MGFYLLALQTEHFCFYLMNYLRFLLRDRENRLLALTIYHKAIVPNPICSLREAPKL